MEGSFQRARRPEQKQERREAILAAARRIADRQGVRSVSLADIAADVGVHKSALLRYFETREEIYLELTAAAWVEWRAWLEAALGEVAPGDAGSAASVLARSFSDRPLFCDLLVHTPLNLERHVSVEAVRRYKRVSLAAVGHAGDLLAACLPVLSDEEGREVVATVASLAGNIWQIAHPPAALAELYRSAPEFAGACIEVAPFLERTAGLLIAGLIAGH